MSITLHCEHCGKKVKAPDSVGGKWGKCPSCHNKIYVPSADSGGEALKLTPIDAQDIVKQKKLMAETYKLRQDLLQEKEKPTESGKVVSGAGGAFYGDERQLNNDIITYLLHMANGQLDEAENLAEAITVHGSKATAALDQIALSDMPEPELADIQPQVLAGLIRTLRSKIG